MKKWLKITLISLGSLLGLVLLAFAVVCWLVFTPSKLTGIVNSLATKFVQCDTHFEKVDLTLFRTFPDAGLQVHDVVLVNPCDFAPSDTLAHIQDLTVAVNVRDFIKHGSINVRQLLLDGVDAHLAVSPEGNSNFDIFPKSEDTTTTEFKLPDMDLRKISVQNLNATYLDQKGHLDASLADLSLNVKGSWQDTLGDADLRLSFAALNLAKGDSLGRDNLKAFAENVTLSADGKYADQSVHGASLKFSGDSVFVALADSVGHKVLEAALDNLGVKLKGDGSASQAAGTLSLELPRAAVSAAGTQWVNIQSAGKHDLLKVELPFAADIDSLKIALNDAAIALAQYKLALSGTAQLPADSTAMALDMSIGAKKWPVADLLALLPKQFTSWQKGMDLDAKLSLDAKVKGQVSDTAMPLIDAQVQLADGRFSYPKAIPYKLNKISADLQALLDLNKGAKSRVNVRSIKAVTGQNDIALSGRVDDLLGKMLADLNLKGNIALVDLKPILPDSLPLEAKGKAAVDLNLKTTLDQLTNLDLPKMKASGTIDIKKFDVTYDSIHAASPDLTLALQLPAQRHNAKVNELFEVRISGPQLAVQMPSSSIDANLSQPDILVGLNNILDSKKQLAASCNLSLNALGAKLDSMDLSTGKLSLKGDISMDSTRKNILLKLNPDLDVDMQQAKVSMPNLAESLQMPRFRFNYVPGHCKISQADINVGRSDYHLSGTVLGLEDWIEHEQMLTGDLSFTSSFTDLDQLLDLISGLGSDPDTLAAQRQEDHVAKEANPFIVPKDVDFVLHTHIAKTLAFGNDLSSVEGGVYIKDGTAILDQVGFVCKAARMQLTAMYKSPRPNHLYLGLDFHLLDIQIDELIDMIPYVDTLVPMLSAFNGNADFHIAGETYLNALYQPKVSTIRGAAAITGKDLVVLDSETFSTISKLMMFSRKTENKIDSLDVEATAFRDEVEIYPFLLSMDKYQVVAGGRHTLSNDCDYHLEIIKCPIPGRVAVDVKGNLKKPRIALGKVQYGELYKPEKRNDTQQYTMDLKNKILKSLQANVR